MTKCYHVIFINVQFCYNQVNNRNRGVKLMDNNFFPIISGALGGIISNSFKGPIKTVEEWWYITFGHTISEKAEKLRIQQQINVEKFKHEILNEIQTIGPENIQEPKAKIIGPALEASKYYLDEDDLRRMFAKLIASSLDKDKNPNMHSSFTEIIKQLDPIDAENLAIIYREKQCVTCNIKETVIPIGGFITLFDNVFIDNPNQTDANVQSASITNLQRLGLIYITFEEFRHDANSYKKFYDSIPYKMATSIIDQNNLDNQKNKQYNPELYSKLGIEKYGGPEIQKGLVKMTPYGNHFCEICLK